MIRRSFFSLPDVPSWPLAFFVVIGVGMSLADRLVGRDRGDAGVLLRRGR